MLPKCLPPDRPHWSCPACLYQWGRALLEGLSSHPWTQQEAKPPFLHEGPQPSATLSTLGVAQSLGVEMAKLSLKAGPLPAGWSGCPPALPGG